MSERYLVFIAGNALLVEVGDGGRVAIRNNRVGVEVPLSTCTVPLTPPLPLTPNPTPSTHQVATVYLNDALSFVPCFKYARVRVFVGLRVSVGLRFRVRDSVMNSPFFPYPPPRPCPAIYPPSGTSTQRT